MFINYAYLKSFQTKSFLQDQFIFEKVVLQKIKECNNIESPSQYQICTNIYKEKKRSYKRFVQNIVENRNLEVRIILQNHCLNQSSMQKLEQCMEKQTQNLHKKNFPRDIKLFSDLRQNIIEGIIN